MANYIVTDEQLTDIADAIRGKTGQSGALAFPDGFVNGIGSITVGGSVKKSIQSLISCNFLLSGSGTSVAGGVMGNDVPVPYDWVRGSPIQAIITDWQGTASVPDIAIYPIADSDDNYFRAGVQMVNLTGNSLEVHGYATVTIYYWAT